MMLVLPQVRWCSQLIPSVFSTAFRSSVPWAGCAITTHVRVLRSLCLPGALNLNWKQRALPSGKACVTQSKPRSSCFDLLFA